MMEANKQMSRVANDFLWRQDNYGWPRPEPEWGITQARWNSYKELFRKVGSEDGTVHDEKSSDVEIIIHSWGIVPAGGKRQFRSLRTACRGTPTHGFTMFREGHGERRKQRQDQWRRVPLQAAKQGLVHLRRVELAPVESHHPSAGWGSTPQIQSKTIRCSELIPIRATLSLRPPC